MKSFFLSIIIALCAVGCTTYKPGVLIHPLRSDASALVIVPADARYEKFDCPGTGQATATAVYAAFSRHLTRVEMMRGAADFQANLLAARNGNFTYLVTPEIVRWKDPSKKLFAMANLIQIQIKLQITDTVSGKTLETGLLERRSGWDTSAAVRPEDLLSQMIGDYINSLFEGDHAYNESNNIQQEALPYVYPFPQVARPDSPTLIIGQVADGRGAKDGMDEVLDLPACLEAVIFNELAQSGLFSKVEPKSPDQGQSDHDYVLQCTLNELKFEIPDINKKARSAHLRCELLGVIGEQMNYDTKWDVTGRSKMRFIVSKKGQGGVLLDREYSVTSTVQKLMYKSESPESFREVAAVSFQKIMDQFRGDLTKVMSVDSNKQQ